MNSLLMLQKELQAFLTSSILSYFFTFQSYWAWVAELTIRVSNVSDTSTTLSLLYRHKPLILAHSALNRINKMVKSRKSNRFFPEHFRYWALYTVFLIACGITAFSDMGKTSLRAKQQKLEAALILCASGLAGLMDGRQEVMEPICEDLRFSSPEMMKVCERYYKFRGSNGHPIVTEYNKIFVPVHNGWFGCTNEEDWISRIKRSVERGTFDEILNSSSLHSFAVVNSSEPAQCASTVNGWGEDMTTNVITDIATEEMFTADFEMLTVKLYHISGSVLFCHLF